MKKTITLLSVFITCATAANAQIPNGDFEAWTKAPANYDSATSWETLNYYTAPMATAIKGTPGAAGSTAYMALTTKMVITTKAAGIAVCGKIDPVARVPKSGFPYSVRSANLIGKWQYMAAATTDNGYIGVWLTKWNISKNRRDTVAMKVHQLTGMKMAWEDFTIPLDYKLGDTPDSAIVALSSSGLNPEVGSYLYVDNLAFSGTAANVPTTTYTRYNTNIYPNPTNGNISIDFGMNVTSDVHVQVLDIMGRVTKDVMLYAGQQIYPVQMDRLSPGTYYLKMQVDNDVQTKRVVIQ